MTESLQADVKRLDDQLRDTENELNMSRAMPKTNPQDTQKIAELTNQLLQQQSTHDTE